MKAKKIVLKILLAPIFMLGWVMYCVGEKSQKKKNNQSKKSN